MGAEMLHVWTDDEEWVVARDAQDARAVMAEIGCDLDPDIEFELCPDDQVFTIYQDEQGSDAVTKTFAEWAAGNGRGYLCASMH